MIEYAISAGPGTLIDYGVDVFERVIRNHRSGTQKMFPELMDAGRTVFVVGLKENLAMRRVTPDCVTGQ